MQKKSFASWMDYLRITATVSVVLLHVAGRTLVRNGKAIDFNWWAANILDSSVRFSVPVFVMLSGALLLPKDEETGAYLRKRMSRIALPFLFWSAVYIGVYYSSMLSKGIHLNSTQSWEWLITIVSNGIAIHLWYVFMITGLYLFIPILGKWARQASEKEIWYFLALWTLTICIGLLPKGSSFIAATHLTYFASFVGYLVLGFFLSRKAFNRQKVLPLALILVLLGTLITALGTYFLTVKKGSLDELFYGFLTPNVIIASVGVFMLFKLGENSPAKPGKILRVISQYSYGIFLVHILVLTLLEKLAPWINQVNEIVATPVLTIVCLSLSLAIVYSLNRLPLGKYISGGN